MSVLSKPYFHSEEAAFSYLESVIWSDGTVCTHSVSLEDIVTDAAENLGKSQSDKFKEAARELEADEDETRWKNG